MPRMWRASALAISSIIRKSLFWLLQRWGVDHLGAMRVFMRVVEAGGLSAAGRVLGLAPSSVSRRIGELESDLGVRLLNRTTRKLSLTEAGQTYYEGIGEILRAVDEVGLAVREQRAAPSGTLRLTVPASVARLHLTPAVAAFRALAPSVRVAMTVTDRMVDLVGEGLDLAIRLGRLEDSSLMARKLGEAPRLVCASPAYLARAGRPERPEQLAGHDCLPFRWHAGSALWRFQRDKEAVEVRVSGPLCADDGACLVAAAEAGLGVILVPQWLVGPALASGALERLLPDWPPGPATTPLWALYPPGPYVPAKVRAFIDFLAERFERRAPPR